jgi:hypothetical protein
VTIIVKIHGRQIGREWEGRERRKRERCMIEGEGEKEVQGVLSLLTLRERKIWCYNIPAK